MTYLKNFLLLASFALVAACSPSDPAIVDWAPTGSDVPVDTEITVWFAGSLNTSVTGGTGSMLLEGQQLAYAFTYEPEVDGAGRTALTFQLDPNLAYDTTYDIADFTPLLSQAGIRPDALPKGWTFTTEAAPDAEAPGDEDPAPTAPDGDGDGVPDEDDNCPAVSNPDQHDQNHNGVGDACDDADGDGVRDDVDPAPNVPGFAPNIASFEASPAEVTTSEGTSLTWTVESEHGPELRDEEGLELTIDPEVGPVTDSAGSTTVTPTAATTYTLTASNIYGSATATVDVAFVDSDGDGVPDGDDNCGGTANEGQHDEDGDGVGDACDGGYDGDEDEAVDCAATDRLCVAYGATNYAYDQDAYGKGDTFVGAREVTVANLTDPDNTVRFSLEADSANGFLDIDERTGEITKGVPAPPNKAWRYVTVTITEVETGHTASVVLRIEPAA